MIGPASVRALLAVKATAKSFIAANGTRAPWATAIVSDLAQLQKYYTPRLDWLGDPAGPDGAITRWSHFMSVCGDEWSLLVKNFVDQSEISSFSQIP